MSRYSRPCDNNALFAILVLVGACAWTHREQVVSIAYMILGVMGCLLLLRLGLKFVVRRRFVAIRDVDRMNGLEFEQYIAELLRKNGFHNVCLTEKYDLGVDIIAEKDGTRWGIQTKCYTGLVKADSVRQAVTGLRLYDCDRAMVITNSVYSAVAQRLAVSNDCLLIDRSGLNRLKNNRGVIL
ncbi:integral membrane protein [Candidatus Saccharibacteria bacterium RAAC3_TM7_1]|nr:integral membrane protein [Candidatus Saccharibacteria bacterium RAAC3_TM7_1]